MCDSNSLLNGWLRRVQVAVSALVDTPLIFRPWVKDPSIAAHSGEAVTLLDPIVAPDSEFDEEALPFVRVRCEDGTIVVAEPDELFSESPHWLECFSAICSGFAVARECGDFVGPYHLAEEGTAEQQSAFAVHVDTWMADSLGQHWNTPAEFVRVQAPQTEHAHRMSENQPCPDPRPCGL